MGISSYGLLIFLLVVQFTVGIFGGYAGYTVEGVPSGGAVEQGSVPLLGVLDYIWDGIVFMFDMTTFQIDGMPEVVSIIFVGMALLTVFLVIRLVRGVS